LPLSLPQVFTPASGFACPLLPWVPSAGMMFNSFLIGTLTKFSFLFWGVWMAICICIYLAYGLHHTQGENQPPALAVSDKAGTPSGPSAAKLEKELAAVGPAAGSGASQFNRNSLPTSAHFTRASLRLASETTGATSPKI
jgi:hypothetical protein